MHDTTIRCMRSAVVIAAKVERETGTCRVTCNHHQHASDVRGLEGDSFVMTEACRSGAPLLALVTIHRQLGDINVCTNAIARMAMAKVFVWAGYRQLAISVISVRALYLNFFLSLGESR